MPTETTTRGTCESTLRSRLAALAMGDSVSVDGCCLTATEVADGRFAVTAVPETISRTTLGGLAAGRRGQSRDRGAGR